MTRKSVSDALIRLAEARRCPACERKSALLTCGTDGDVTIKVCRWCGHEKRIGEVRS